MADDPTMVGVESTAMDRWRRVIDELRHWLPNSGGRRYRGWQGFTAPDLEVFCASPTAGGSAGGYGVGPAASRGRGTV